MLKIRWKRSGLKYDRREKDIDPDEIFIDSSNLPNFDVDQFEGRIEKPISRKSIFTFSGVFLLIVLIFIGRVWILQINNGDYYFKIVYNKEGKIISMDQLKVNCKCIII